MEKRQTDQQSIDDEPNPKRPKMETDVSTSTSSKPKTVGDEPFLSLPSDVLVRIIRKLPVAQWSSLELLDKHFRATTWIAWRQLRNVNVEREFNVPPEDWRNRSLFTKTVISILQKLVERSPFLASISGIEIEFENAGAITYATHLLAQFEHLQSMNVGSVDRSGVIRRGLGLDTVVELLELTRSRASLKELRFFNVDGLLWSFADVFVDQLASSFVHGREIQLPLKLEKFSFSSVNVSEDSICLHTIDTTRLTDVRLGKTPAEPEELIDLIQRASNLRRIELSFLECERPCHGPRLEGNKKLLTALAAHENLTSIKFDHNGDHNDIDCTDFAPEFIEMLKAIGRRGRLRELSLEENFAHLCTLDMDEICAMIGAHMPRLQSIKLHVSSSDDGRIVNVVNLAELEQIRLNNWHSPLTADTIKKIAQLPRLKRLSFNEFPDKDSLKYLTNAPALTDLRIQYAASISAVVFDEWSGEFVSKLEVLMLDRFGTKDQREEEAFVRLLERAVRLRVLILGGPVDNRALAAIASSCPKLEIFGVSYWRPAAATIRHLQEIVMRCPKLKQLGACNLRNALQLPKHRVISDVDMKFSKYDFDDTEYD